MSIERRLISMGVAAALASTLGGCVSDGTTPGEPSPRTRGQHVLLAAGDIAGCRNEGDEMTARIIEAESGSVATLGDNAYPDGTPQQFDKCYGPSWGRFKDRTRPALGNHEYATRGAAGYFEYFGRAAGERPGGWYAYQLGAWHIVVLNSNCRQAGGCKEGSPQARWLDRELQRKGSACTLAYFHHPRFSSGKSHGNTRKVEPFWRILYRYGADVVLSAHDHDYERFRPLTPRGRIDPTRGLRQFVVGTAGGILRPFGSVEPGSVVREADTFGILKLVLGAGRYSWEFVPVDGQAFTDTGSGRCH